MTIRAATSGVLGEATQAAAFAAKDLLDRGMTEGPEWDRACLDLLNCCELMIKKLARRMARGRYHRGYDREDLLSAGRIAVLQSLRRWEPEKGNFLIYSWYWVWNEMQVLAGHSRWPVTIHPLAYRMALYLERGRPIPENRRRSIVKALTVVKGQIEEIAEGTLYEEFADEVTARDQVERLLRPLSARQRENVVRYFGLHGEPPESMRQIAARHGMTRYAVEKSLKKALRKIQGE